jgi:hypothetical protein
MVDQSQGFNSAAGQAALYNNVAARSRLQRASRLLRDAAVLADNATDLLALQGWDVRRFRAVAAELRGAAERVVRP